MKARLSSKGQIVLPGPIRKKLGFAAGDSLEVTVEGDRVVLTRGAEAAPRLRIKNDPVTGLPVLSPVKPGPVLTSDQVAALLSEFP